METVMVVMAIVFGLLLVAALVYVWRNRPVRTPGDDWRDEQALRADKWVNRSGGGGL